MSEFYLPKNYQPLLNMIQTEKAIKSIKDFFQTQLALALNLRRITAPLFVQSGLGINDDLNGLEKPISFKIKAINNIQVEIVQSLAKWKRLMLAQLNMKAGEGIYTDMNAIRPDEIPDPLHSLYVDQWDWEKVITPEQRNLELLKDTVRKIYHTLYLTDQYIHHEYRHISPILPENITFIHAEELHRRYPTLTPKQRENEICRQFLAVFIIGIGYPINGAEPHDGRAPDYDDWSSDTGQGKGLNGDILLWYPILNQAMEISSMGIRVDKTSLLRQLELSNTMARQHLLFHQKLLNDQLPLSIGGGIGQSRLCTFFLRKAHIGEVQSSIWPEEMVANCRQHNIMLL